MAWRSALPLRLCIQAGCWECQARVWPRTCLPFCTAQLWTRSPAVKSNRPCWGSVASIFISFSAVTELNSRFAIVVYVESLSLPDAMAVPKYRPVCAAALPSVLSAACEVGGATSTVAEARTPTMSAAQRPPVFRRTVDGVACKRMTGPPVRKSRMDSSAAEEFRDGDVRVCGKGRGPSGRNDSRPAPRQAGQRAGGASGISLETPQEHVKCFGGFSVMRPDDGAGVVLWGACQGITEAS